MSKNMTKDDWAIVAEKIKMEADANALIFGLPKVENIQHYLDHGEFEIAFQYLMMEIMENKTKLLKMSVEEVLDIGILLNLNDVNTHLADFYISNFWEKLSYYLSHS